MIRANGVSPRAIIATTVPLLLHGALSAPSWAEDSAGPPPPTASAKTSPEPARIAALVADLGSADAGKREAASNALAAMDRAAVSALRKALKDPRPEVRTRSEGLLRRLLPPIRIFEEIQAAQTTLTGREKTLGEAVQVVQKAVTVPVELGDGVDPARSIKPEERAASVPDLLDRIAGACGAGWVIEPGALCLVRKEVIAERLARLQDKMNGPAPAVEYKGVTMREALAHLYEDTDLPVVLADDLLATPEIRDKVVDVKCRIPNQYLALNWIATRYVSGLSINTRNGVIVLSAPKQMPRPKPPTTGRNDFYGKPLPSEALARIAPVEGHRFVFAVAPSPDGRTLFTGGLDDTCRLWSVVTGRELLKIEAGGQVIGIALSPDGRLLATAGNPLRVWDVTDGRVVATFKGYRGLQFKMAFSPDGRTLASGGEDGALYLWDAMAGTLRSRLEGHRKAVSNVAYSPDGKALVTSSWDGTVRVWDPAHGAEVRTIPVSKDRCQGLAVSPDGRTAAVGDQGGWIRIVDVAEGRVLREFNGDLKGDVDGVAFSPDGALLAAGRFGSTLELWDPTTGKRVHRFANSRENRILSVAFSPNGRKLYASSERGTVLVYDAAEHRAKLPPLPSRPPADLQGLWATLSGADVVKAHDALRDLAAAGPPAVAFLKERLASASSDPETEEKIKRWIVELDHDDFAVRERAFTELKKSGSLAAPALRRALAEGASAEARGRIQSILESGANRAAAPAGDAMRRELTCVALEWIGTDAAKAVLEKAASESASDRERLEASAALARLKRSTAAPPRPE